MARSWVGRTIFGCWPCMAMLRLREARHSYMNCTNTEECYECAVVSRKMVDQIRSSPTLRHKGYFAYEWLCIRHTGLPEGGPPSGQQCRGELRVTPARSALGFQWSRAGVVGVYTEYV